MTVDEILVLLKEAHDEGYNSGWNKGRDAGVRSIAIGVDAGYPNKAQSWEIFKNRVKVKLKEP